jgi:RsiW-degrading membrane proteinase PrsW (M82 family)
MFVVLSLFSVLFASIPMFGFLAAVWWLDRHDREPVWLVLLTFAWGAIGGVGFALVGNQLFMEPLGWILGPDLAETWAAAIVAPLAEEPAKALILLAVMQSRTFDGPSDGFVYGAAAGLGFGMTENMLYFTTVAASGDVMGWMFTVVVRTFYSAVMHAAATAWVGAALGAARFGGWPVRIVAIPLGFAGAMGMHAAWNGLLTLQEVAPDLAPWRPINFVGLPIEVAIVFITFQIALWEERRVLRRELADEVQTGLLPLTHASAVASVIRRGRPGWLPAGIPQALYVKAVTRLALRKHQCRRVSERSYPWYADEVMRLRREVQALQALGKQRMAVGG